jgi:arylsulfate sulfotransferase
MIKNGDDPSDFVRDGVDWFHMNSAIYDPSDRAGAQGEIANVY